MNLRKVAMIHSRERGGGYKEKCPRVPRETRPRGGLLKQMSRSFRRPHRVPLNDVERHSPDSPKPRANKGRPTLMSAKAQGSKRFFSQRSFRDMFRKREQRA